MPDKAREQNMDNIDKMWGKVQKMKKKNITDTREKIDNIIEDYKMLFPAEYDSFAISMKIKQKNLKNKFAEMKGTEYFDRKIWEMPETLYVMLDKNLTKQEFDQYFNNTKRALTTGQKWFLRKYPMFRSAEKI